MAVTTTNINVSGAVVRLGGTVTADGGNADWYDVSPQGTDVGCTQGGVTVTYSLDLSDIFCDQITVPVDVAITGETAAIEFSMLESTAENMKLALADFASSEDEAGVAYWLGVGGINTVSFTPLELEITDNDTGYLTTWTFFRTICGGIETNFERENPTAFGVTFTAYADTTHSSGKQLFQVRQNKA
jgi:hypothetical protein